MMVLMCRFLARLLASPGSSSSPAAPQTSKTKHWLKNGSKRSTQVITGQQNLPAFVRPEVYTKAQGDLHAAFAAVENLSIRGFQHVPTVKTHVNNCQYVTLPVCHFNTFHSKTSHFSDGLQVAVLPLQLVDGSRASLTWSKCPRKSNQARVHSGNSVADSQR